VDKFILFSKEDFNLRNKVLDNINFEKNINYNNIGIVNSHHYKKGIIK
jgi:hypothetical protein